MYTVEIYGRVRGPCWWKARASVRWRRSWIARETVRKMLRYSVATGLPAGAAGKAAQAGAVDRRDQRHSGRRQEQPSKAAAYGEADLRPVAAGVRLHGGYTIVKDYVRLQGARTREMFVPLTHAPGKAQADFREAWVIVRRSGMQGALTSPWNLPQSDDCFVAAFPAETTEAFLEGHVRAFAYFGECRGRFSTTTTSWRWRRFWGAESGRRPGRFSELQSHYLFEEKFGRPGKGNDKGKVEGLVGYARRKLYGTDSACGELGGVEHASAGAVREATGKAVARKRRDDCGAFRARSHGTVAAAGGGV